MDNSVTQRISDALQRSKTVAIAVGKNPTIDDMGAALALYLSLQTIGKQATIVSGSEPIVELSNLVGIDKVKTRYEAGGADLIVSFPYREGEIEKVSYTIDNGFLNIVVKAGEQGLTFTEQDVKYTHGSGQLDLLFVIGTSRLADIHHVFTADALKDVTVINIDNKPDNQGYGDIVMVSTQVSSISEQMTQILSELKMPVDADIAQNLLDGITFATENFQSSQTSYLAFEMASMLLRQGAIRSRSEQAARTRQDFIPNPIAQPQQIQRQHQSQQSNQDRNGRQQFDQRRTQQPHHVQQTQLPVQSQPLQNQPQTQQQNEAVDDLNNPPTDWLTPKVYKGSSNV